ncbi:hypothetical protein AGMMS49936_05240 [Endomicrobiia bacterium]|nr:hypothetical protein AGMMS49936_05240 [Endomicrobiia bacterium]
MNKTMNPVSKNRIALFCGALALIFAVFSFAGCDLLEEYHGDGSVTFLTLAANGSAAPDITTTRLTLTFSEPITGLTASHITITANGTGTTKGALTGSWPTYQLTVTGITSGGVITVAVSNPPGYTITPASKTVAVFKYTTPTVVAFNTLTANDSASATTTTLTLTFSEPITGLTASHITIIPNGTGTTKGVLTGSGTTYQLTVTGITSDGTITVAVSNPPGYTITPASKTVAVKYIPVYTAT